MTTPTSPATCATAPCCRRTSRWPAACAPAGCARSIGTLAATAVAFGGLAVWQNAATTASPNPAPPITQPADPAYPASPAWRQVVDGTDSHPFETEGTEDGSIAVVWRGLEHPEPTYALVIREADGTVHGRLLDAPVSLTPVPGGWVGLRTARAWFISSDGTWTELGDAAASRTPRPGDVLVAGQYADLLYSPDDRSIAAVDLPPSSDGYVTPDGVIATCQWNGRDEIFFSPSDKALSGLPGKTCVLAGRDDVLAMIALGDAPDGSIPMTGLKTYSDLTWHPRRTTDLLAGVTSVVVTAGGSTIITNASDGRWLRVTRDGEVTEPEDRLGLAFVAGDRLYATAYGFMQGPLLYSDDDGVTWKETTLPGME